MPDPAEHHQHSSTATLLSTLWFCSFAPPTASYSYACATLSDLGSRPPRTQRQRPCAFACLSPKGHLLPFRMPEHRGPRQRLVPKIVQVYYGRSYSKKPALRHYSESRRYHMGWSWEVTRSSRQGEMSSQSSECYQPCVNYLAVFMQSH